MSTKAQITSDGMKLEVMLPHKIFNTGRIGFFKQGMIIADNGQQYRINLQVYEVK